jgi:hypothetical protein
VLPEIKTLEHHAELGAQALHLFAVRRHQAAVTVLLHGDGLAMNCDRTGSRQFQHVDTAQEGRFARAAAADDGDHVAFIRGQ